MKAMHLGIWIDDEQPGAVDALVLPKGVITDNDSFLVWGEDIEDGTLHLIHQYNTADLPLDEHNMTGFGPVRGWVRQQGVWDRERQHIVAIRKLVAEALVPTTGMRLLDYVLLSDNEDWAEDQHIWTLDGILSRVA